MTKYNKLIVIIGLVISTLVGLWHFFVPYLYQWYSYIPEAPRAIIVSVDWINFLFSLLLSGNSIILIFFRKKLFKGDNILVTYYGFLVGVWFCRIVITIIHPWNYDFMLLGQLVAFIIIFALMAYPFSILIKDKIKQSKIMR